MKKILKCTAVILFVALVLTVIQFFQNNLPNKGNSSREVDILYVLAPYEARIHRQILDEIARDYGNIEGNKKVIFEYVREEEYKKEICLRMDRGEAADLIICGNQMMPALVEIGVFRDISDYITAEKKNSICYPSLWDSTRNDGGYYGIPFTCDPYVLFYNHDVLEQKGSAIPQTWEELFETSGRVQNYGTYGFGFPGRRVDERCLFFSHMLYSKGGSYRNINKEAGVTSFAQLRMISNRKYIPPETINWSGKDLAEAFADGRVEMIADRLSMLSIIRTSAVKFKVGITSLPEEVKNARLLLGENIGLSSDADEEAAAFLDYLYRPEIMERITYAMDTLPVLYQVPYKTKVILPDEGQSLREIYQTAGYSLEPYEAWFEISSELSKQILAAMSDADTSDEQLAAMAHENVRMAIIEK